MTIRPARRAWLSFLLAVCASIFAWTVFAPGVLSVDSFYFLTQATYAVYSDMHGLLLPALLGGLFKIGGNLRLLMLVQCIAGFFGVRALSLAVPQILQAPSWARDAAASFLVILLASPLTPFAIYAMTIWTDTWLSILLTWMLALIVRLRLWVPPGGHDFSRALVICGIALLFVAALLVRPNTFLLFPAFVALVVAAMPRVASPRAAMLALVLAVPAAYLAATQVLYRVLDAERMHPERAVFAMDLASMCLLRPVLCQANTPELTSTCQTVYQDFRPGFIPGNGAIDFTYNQGEWVVYIGFLRLVEDPNLGAALRAAVRRSPATLLRAKVLNYLDYLRPDPERYFFAHKIPRNQLGVMYDARFTRAREGYFAAAEQTAKHPVRRWFSFVHNVWLIADLALVAGFALLAVRWSSRRAAFLAWMSVLPLAYYGSYLVALTASDFRFMYPATLITQVMLITVLIQSALRFGQREVIRVATDRCAATRVGHSLPSS